MSLSNGAALRPGGKGLPNRVGSIDRHAKGSFLTTLPSLRVSFPPARMFGLSTTSRKLVKLLNRLQICSRLVTEITRGYFLQILDSNLVWMSHYATIHPVSPPCRLLHSNWPIALGNFLDIKRVFHVSNNSVLCLSISLLYRP